MSTRRTFFSKLASGLVVAAAPTLFLPKLIKPAWKASPSAALAYSCNSLGIYAQLQQCGLAEAGPLNLDDLLATMYAIKRTRASDAPPAHEWLRSFFPDGDFAKEAA